MLRRPGKGHEGGGEESRLEEDLPRADSDPLVVDAVRTDHGPGEHRIRVEGDLHRSSPDRCRTAGERLHREGSSCCYCRSPTY